MILNLLFPRRCVSCNKLGRYICLSCRQKIKSVNLLFCPICRYPSLNGVTHPRCRKQSVLDGLFVASHYSGPVKKAIHLLKYRYVSDLVMELTGLLFVNLPLFLRQFDFIVPVPLHPKREKDRGFNQSFLIGLSLGKKLALPVRRDLLFRCKNTKPQFGLKVEARKINVKNVFQLKSYAFVRNKKICLVDDVATTLSTLNECAKVLKKSGAASVYAVVLAHGK